MQPRVFIVGEMDSPVVRTIIETLQAVGILTFHAGLNLRSGDVWSKRIQEELNRADCAILVLESTLKYERSADSLYSTNEIEAVVNQRSKNPNLTIIPVIETTLSPNEIPTELLRFQAVYFTQGLSSSDFGLLIDTIFRTWHSIEVSVPPLEQVTAEANVLNARLNFILSQSRVVDIILLVLSLVATGLGVALSIPSVLANWFLPQYWLFLAPIITVIGGVSTIYLFMRERQERRRVLIAGFVQKQLSELIEKAELLRQQKRQLMLEKQKK